MGWTFLLLSLLCSIPTFIEKEGLLRTISACSRFVITLLAIIWLLVSFALSATLYNGEYCNLTLKNSFGYGYGFGMLVTSWCLTVFLLAFEVLTILAKLKQFKMYDGL
eukprot:TRINITY_DN32770_c0_g1_i1.p1 TRINITY_DN32770_c0_g1~~TRINITY_DN32770_c0_g1_i1.p1  ORF type:complete len:108 (+),score=4.94 TRINITY_DN32770_c0_g1_i1:263-586(+)